MKQITPYLFFEGNCREAMNYYKDIFGGELFIMTVGESPEKDKEHMPDNKDAILHASINVGDTLMLMASDTMQEGQKADMGEGVYNTILCSSKEEIDTLFARLSDGGNVAQPLIKAFFGWFGIVTDKFGVKWMLTFDSKEQ